jgi:hypothetical protein
LAPSAGGALAQFEQGFHLQLDRFAGLVLAGRGNALDLAGPADVGRGFLLVLEFHIAAGVVERLDEGAGAGVAQLRQRALGVAPVLVALLLLRGVFLRLGVGVLLPAALGVGRDGRGDGAGGEDREDGGEEQLAAHVGRPETRGAGDIPRVGPK